MRRCRLRIPLDRFDLVDLVHREGDVHREEHQPDAVWIEADVPTRFHKALQGYVTERMAE